MLDLSVWWNLFPYTIPFPQIITKVNNKDNYYKAIKFYLEEHPTLIGDLMQTIASKVDHTQVVTLVRELGHLPLIKNYLINVQDANIHAVNEALNALYIEEEDYEALRHSIETYQNFDALELARKLEKHELIEFRRIAAVLYKQNGKFAKSIDLCKENKLFQDAAKCAADSDDVEVAEVRFHNIIIISPWNANHDLQNLLELAQVLRRTE